MSEKGDVKVGFKFYLVSKLTFAGGAAAAAAAC